MRMARPAPHIELLQVSTRLETVRGRHPHHDNLRPHKKESTLALIAAAGASGLFLPAYSPDLNLIEKM